MDTVRYNKPLPALGGWLLLLLLCLSWPLSAGERVYQQPSEFLHGVFGRNLPPTQMIALGREQQARVQRLLGHPYRTNRVRYWSNGLKTAWILEEIGKTEPITTGYVVAGGRIEQVKVLIYREIHGYEVASHNFCKQFKGANLNANGTLSKPIRNLAGATLSTRALTGLARVAIYFDSIK